MGGPEPKALAVLLKIISRPARDDGTNSAAHLIFSLHNPRVVQGFQEFAATLIMNSYC